MNLNDHIQTIAKVAEVAGKEYSIEQVGDENMLFLSEWWDLKFIMHFQQNICNIHLVIYYIITVFVL